MTQADARQIAADYIGEGLLSEWGVTPVIVDGLTLQIDIGWVFFYESAEYLETGEFSQRLAGNAPVVVSGFGGHLYVTGTAQPVEKYLPQIREEERLRVATASATE